MALAQRTNGVIVNADSAQVYADLQILTARPAEAEMGGVEHRLYGHRDGAQPCSAAEWAEEAREVIDEAHQQDRLPILVGGTGLYIRTLLDGIAAVPRISETVREEVRNRVAAENHRLLADLDPEAARRLHPNDTTRVGRALEVVLSSGQPLSHWQTQREGGIGHRVELFGLALEGPLTLLEPAIDRRCEAMVEAGAMAEVERLLDRQLSPTLPVMKAIGVPELASHLRGETNLDEALSAMKLSTRQYAKRQVTWFRHQYLGLGPMSPGLFGPGHEVALSSLSNQARRLGCSMTPTLTSPRSGPGASPSSASATRGARRR